MPQQFVSWSRGGATDHEPQKHSADSGAIAQLQRQLEQFRSSPPGRTAQAGQLHARSPTTHQGWPKAPKWTDASFGLPTKTVHAVLLASEDRTFTAEGDLRTVPISSFALDFSVPAAFGQATAASDPLKTGDITVSASLRTGWVSMPAASVCVFWEGASTSAGTANWR